MIIYAVTWLDHENQGIVLNERNIKHRLISYYHSSELSKYIKEYKEKGAIKKENDNLCSR
jgi:hypothetical protein